MANISKIKLGTETPDSIMFDKLYLKQTDLKFDFTNWEINTSAGHDLVIEPDKIIINKFKPNVWLIRDKIVTGAPNHAICEYCQGTVMYSTGISEHTDILQSGYRADNNLGAGNDIPEFLGFCIYPARFDAGCVKMLPQRAYTWERTWVDANNRTGVALADHAAFRLGSGGHSSYGIWQDFTGKTMFPDDLYDFNSWDKQTSAQTTTWRYTMALYTGRVQDFSDLTWTIANSAVREGNKIKITTRIADGESGYHVAKQAGINAMKLKIAGLSEGDRFEYGTTNSAVDQSENSITTDGTYDIPAIGSGSNGVAFRVYGTGTSEITIEFVNEITDENGLIDITDSPITLYIKNTNGLNLSSIECWDVYTDTEQVYHKDKTTANCYIKHGYLLESTLEEDKILSFKDVNNELSKYPNVSSLVIPVTDDLSNLNHYYSNDYNSIITFNVPVANEDFWDVVKQMAADGKILIITTEYGVRGGVFQYSNISGTLNWVIPNTDYSLAADRCFEFTYIDTVNFTFKDPEIIDGGTRLQRLMSCNTLFKSSSITTITTNRTFGSADLSGMFEYCGLIQTIPGIINYTFVDAKDLRCLDPNLTVVSGIYSHNPQWMYEQCNNLITIEKSQDAVYISDIQNVCAPQTMTSMFRDCYNLVTVNTVLKMTYMYPYMASLAFNYCNKLETLYLQGLNHGSWAFDGQSVSTKYWEYTDESQTTKQEITRDTTIGNLPSLNKQSIDYLFNNLYDLTTNDPNLTYIPSNAETQEEGNAEIFANNPWVDSANLYCPQEWNDKITTEMIQAANAKGWSIYVNRILRTN